MTLATPTPEQDDYDHTEQEYDPWCPSCGDTGERWTVRDGVAVQAPCDNCTEGEGA